MIMENNAIISNILPSAEIKLGGKDYKFIKPKAVELIDIEDSCFTESGVDNIKYYSSVLGLVSKELKIDDFVKYNKQVVNLSSGEEFAIPEIGYEAWSKSGAEMDKLSRTKLAQLALKAGVPDGEVTLDNFKYDDINGLAEGYMSLYDDSELQDAVSRIISFCL